MKSGPACSRRTQRTGVPVRRRTDRPDWLMPRRRRPPKNCWGLGRRMGGSLRRPQRGRRSTPRRTESRNSRRIQRKRPLERDRSPRKLQWESRRDRVRNYPQGRRRTRRLAGTGMPPRPRRSRNRLRRSHTCSSQDPGLVYNSHCPSDRSPPFHRRSRCLRSSPRRHRQRYLQWFRRSNYRPGHPRCSTLLQSTPSSSHRSCSRPRIRPEHSRSLAPRRRPAGNRSLPRRGPTPRAGRVASQRPISP